MSPRAIVAALAVGATIAGAGYLAHPAETISKGPPTCAPTVLPGEYRCTFPTHSDLRATVYVQTFEDGSARAYPVDPDKEGMR